MRQYTRNEYIYGKNEDVVVYNRPPSVSDAGEHKRFVASSSHSFGNNKSPLILNYTLFDGPEMRQR